ncbi:MAG TPA: serine hydrolase [Hanamia sp.]|nr:serine hydrolase [Hanamia sp.]
MKKIFYSFLFLLLMTISTTGFSQYKTDKKLEKQLRELLDKFHGTAGVYVRNLKTGKEAAINADTIFPTASIVKIPILVGVFKKINEGDYTYHQSFTYRDSIARGGSGLMQFFKDSTPTDLRTMVSLMLAHSDNTAAVWCEKLAGGGTEINSWLKDNEFKYTRVNARTAGREQENKEYGWGQTTPREMANLLTMIREKKVVSPAASEIMYRALTKAFWDEYALSQIPPYVQAASKQGMVNDSRSEAVLVNAPHGDYVFYIATKNNQDQRWVTDNEAWQLARDVSALLWNYFEPHYGWKPAEGVENYRQ